MCGRPRSAHRLAALAGIQILDTLWLLPLPPDHQLLATVVNLAVLLAYAASGRPSSVDLLVRGFAPTARACVLLAYLAAASSKYNTDFLSTATSCANFMADKASFGLVDRGAPLAVLAIVGTIAAETLIPIFLVYTQDSALGVVLAVTFHYTLSLSPLIGVGDFTVTLWVLYLLFLPIRDVESLGQRLITPLRNRHALVGSLSRVPYWVLTVAALGAIALGSIGGGGILMVLLWLSRLSAEGGSSSPWSA